MAKHLDKIPPDKQKRIRGEKRSAKIMSFAQRFVDGKERAKLNYEDLTWSKNEPYNGAPQATFLMNRKNQRKIFLRNGYLEDNSGNYGPVRNAVINSSHKNVPIYQTYPDANVNKKDLANIGTIMSVFDNDESDGYIGPVESHMADPGYFPTEIYVDRKTGKIYNKGYDYNDYRNTGSSRGKGKIINLAGNILDRIGNPTVVTTGIQERDTYGSDEDERIKQLLGNYGLVYNPDTGKAERQLRPVVIKPKSKLETTKGK